MDTPLDNPDIEIFTDGSSFVRDGKRKAGYAAVLSAEQVLEAKSLPPPPPPSQDKQKAEGRG